MIGFGDFEKTLTILLDRAVYKDNNGIGTETADAKSLYWSITRLYITPK